MVKPSILGLALTVASSIIGVAAGAVQGYFGGLVDLLFQRFIEIWTAIPALMMMLAAPTEEGRLPWRLKLALTGFRGLSWRRFTWPLKIKLRS